MAQEKRAKHLSLSHSDDLFASVASQSSQHLFFLCGTSFCMDFAARWDESLSLTKVSAAANTRPGGSNTLETVCPMKTLIFVEQTANVGDVDSYLLVRWWVRQAAGHGTAKEATSPTLSCLALVRLGTVTCQMLQKVVMKLAASCQVTQSPGEDASTRCDSTKLGACTLVVSITLSSLQRSGPGRV